MKKYILILMFLSCILLANEPISSGATYGNYKFKMNNTIYYPQHTANFAGLAYLQKYNISSTQYIVDTKSKHLNTFINIAKQYAIKNKKKFYAIDNIRHHVSEIDKAIYISTDCNILAFD